VSSNNCQLLTHLVCMQQKKLHCLGMQESILPLDYPRYHILLIDGDDKETLCMTYKMNGLENSVCKTVSAKLRALFIFEQTFVT